MAMRIGFMSASLLSGFMPPRDPDISGLIYSAWSPDGEQVASSIDDGRIFVWSIATGQTLITFEGHSAPVKRLAWNPVSNVVASGDDSGTIWLWDADTGQPIRRMSGHTGIIYDVVWHPNGQELASAGEDGTVRIWEASTGRMKIVDQLELFSAVAYSPDGTQLAYAGEYTGENTVVELVSAPLVESPAPTPTRTPAIAAEE